MAQPPKAEGAFLLSREHRTDSDWIPSYPDHTSTPQVLLAPSVIKQFSLKQQLHRQTG